MATWPLVSAPRLVSLRAMRRFLTLSGKEISDAGSEANPRDALMAIDCRGIQAGRESVDPDETRELGNQQSAAWKQARNYVPMKRERDPSFTPRRIECPRSAPNRPHVHHDSPGATCTEGWFAGASTRPESGGSLHDLNLKSQNDHGKRER